MPVTYAEARYWATYMQRFTQSDLADVVGVPREAVEGFIFGLLWNGTIYDTADRINGRGPLEPIYAYVPLPPGPREHPTFIPPERAVGYTDVLSPRGTPIRIRTERMTRRSLSTPGARSFFKAQERAYQRSVQARMERSAKDKAKVARRGDKLKAREAKAKARAARRREKQALMGEF